MHHTLKDTCERLVASVGEGCILRHRANKGTRETSVGDKKEGETSKEKDGWEQEQPK